MQEERGGKYKAKNKTLKIIVQKFFGSIFMNMIVIIREMTWYPKLSMPFSIFLWDIFICIKAYLAADKIYFYIFKTLVL